MADVSRVELLYDMPACPVLGSYGGGDDMQMSRQIVVRKCNPDKIPAALKERIRVSINEELRNEACIPQDKRISRLPLQIEFEKLIWSCHFQISSHVYGCSKVNIFSHGWLFESVVSLKRLGCSLHPLIGLFDISNGVFACNEESSSIGIERVAWADQHILVDNDPYYHLGSDMASFIVLEDVPIIKFWAVTIDSSTLRADCTLFFLVNYTIEAKLDQGTNQDLDKIKTYCSQEDISLVNNLI